MIRTTFATNTKRFGTHVDDIIICYDSLYPLREYKSFVTLELFHSYLLILYIVNKITKLQFNAYRIIKLSVNKYLYLRILVLVETLFFCSL